MGSEKQLRSMENVDAFKKINNETWKYKRSQWDQIILVCLHYGGFGRSSGAVAVASPQVIDLDVALEFLLLADQFSRARKW